MDDGDFCPCIREDSVEECFTNAFSMIRCKYGVSTRQLSRCVCACGHVCLMEIRKQAGVLESFSPSFSTDPLY